jgi:hypothetical protein
MRLAASIAILVAFTSGAAAQLTQTPGPGGVPIAPGAPVRGWTPGGIGIGGSEIAPGPAAGSEPMYRTAPGGEPVLVIPQRKHERGGAAAAPGVIPPCPGRGCLPDGLRFTVRASETAQAPDAIDSLATLGAAIRACWTPPEGPDAEMSVRFSFRRTGAIMAPPFVTHVSAGTSTEARQTWQRSITDALDRCTPFKFSRRFAAGVSGRPFSVRFVRDRS